MKKLLILLIMALLVFACERQAIQTPVDKDLADEIRSYREMGVSDTVLAQLEKNIQAARQDPNDVNLFRRQTELRHLAWYQSIRADLEKNQNVGTPEQQATMAAELKRVNAILNNWDAERARIHAKADSIWAARRGSLK